MAIMQSRERGEKTMTSNRQENSSRMRIPFRNWNSLMKWNLELQAEVEALHEDNKQLRAAVSIYSEVARRSHAAQSSGRHAA